MQFNEHQVRLCNAMLDLIANFRKDKIQYGTIVNGLEGALDAAEFKDQNFILQWYDHWTPLEILYAVQGNTVTIKDIDSDLSKMEAFLIDALFQYGSCNEIDE